ncbi:MAG: hypothetical protein PGN11_17240 [Quadrisphaera sp.]
MPADLAGHLAVVEDGEGAAVLEVAVGGLRRRAAGGPKSSKGLFTPGQQRQVLGELGAQDDHLPQSARP